MNLQEIDLTILKHILTNKNHALEFIAESNEKIFSGDAWKFAKMVLDYIRLYKEVPTRKVINERNKTLKNEALVVYINNIWDSIDKIKIDEREYKHDLEKIKTRFTEGLINSLKDNLTGSDGRIDIKKSVGEITSTVNHIRSISATKAYEQKTVKEHLSDFRTRYQAKVIDPGFGAGLKTGFKFFDELTGGLQPCENITVCGPTGGGKSIVLNQMAINMWLGANNIDMTSDFKEGCDVVYFSLEMPLESCFERFIANFAGLPQASIRDAKLNAEEKEKMAKALKFIERYPYDLTIVDAPRGASAESIELIFNNIVEAKGRKPKVIVIDYLALIEWHDNTISDWERQGHVAAAIVEIGRVHGINTISAAQMNNEKSKNGESSMGTHRIARSKMVADNANFIWMIEKRPNEKQLPDFKLHLVKSRRSALGEGTMYKKLDCCLLLNEPSDSIFNYADDDISDIVG